ncbi:hypothetical protein LJ739_03610 [Aestuariibacter halophilus]|uniref:Uncharacterized protein n=1 Tax=Fluctibacter halophilus TaxID=226011 RepID=A0ABS8G412_9ALTE|nr:hypothetical protein [Aestuariibacter halophilus]MCC2615322.1 hypothetical protein [Aestuariibacter halophilus]
MNPVHRDKIKRVLFRSNAVLLVLPLWYLYQSLNPTFPDPLAQQSIEELTVTPMPLDNEAPYMHDGVYVKDFMVTFTPNDISPLRQSFMHIGPEPLDIATLEQRFEGMLHGSRYGQHVHALAPQIIGAKDKLWLTVQFWDGRTGLASWSLSKRVTP